MPLERQPSSTLRCETVSLSYADGEVMAALPQQKDLSDNSGAILLPLCPPRAVSDGSLKRPRAARKDLSSTREEAKKRAPLGARIACRLFHQTRPSRRQNDATGPESNCSGLFLVLHGERRNSILSGRGQKGGEFIQYGIVGIVVIVILVIVVLQFL